MSEPVLVLPPVAKILPWHAAAVEQLRAAWRAQHFPHGLLMSGPDGLGKGQLAAWLAGAVLCENSRDTLDVCDRCPSCSLLRAGSHPDLHWVGLEEDKYQISIEQIRAATEQLAKTSYRHGYKVAVIESAHLMTVNAANSLLKTLEEPTARTLIVLITSHPSALLPTVRSRCQKLAIATPAPKDAIAWLEGETGKAVDRGILEFAGGAPLGALAWSDRFEALDREMQSSLAALVSGSDDVTQVAQRWAKDALGDRLTWLDLWLSSVARASVAQNADLFTFPAARAHLPRPPQTLNISGIYGLVDRVRTLKDQLTRTALQRELAVESWLVALLDIMAPMPHQRERTEPSR